MYGGGAEAPIDATLTIAPAPRARIPGRTARTRLTGALKFRAVIASAAAAGTSGKGAITWQPAALTRTSTGPNAPSASVSHPAGSEAVRSRGTERARPGNAAATASRRAVRRATRVSRSPAAPNARAIASPSPEDAPVTATCRLIPLLDRPEA